MCVENMGSLEDCGKSVCVSICESQVVCVFAGGRMGDVIVSRGRCVCLGSWGGVVCRSRKSLLGWSGLRNKGGGVCMCVYGGLCYLFRLRGRHTFLSRLSIDVERTRRESGREKVKEEKSGGEDSG